MAVILYRCAPHGGYSEEPIAIYTVPSDLIKALEREKFVQNGKYWVQPDRKPHDPLYRISDELPANLWYLPLA